MSGLLALLDDVAALAKLAAAQIDDVAAQAAKAGAKAAGVVIDDAAVTPKYVLGLPATRELPIVWQIARGSLFNKLVILTPAALLLSAFLPWLITALLMLGGAYLCFEGAEKIWHIVAPHDDHGPKPETMDAAHLERQRVAGAIKTDFILSAEIMAITLATIEGQGIWGQAVILCVVAIGITLLVYGSVALLVKADDIGLRMAQAGRLTATRALGRAIVKGMPTLMGIIATIGTAAMLWVGGSILVHGMDGLGWGALAHVIYDVAGDISSGNGFLKWLVMATLDGLLGLAVGLLLIPLVKTVLFLIFRGSPAVRAPAK
jgi:predicted DNA repair protein MutK